MNYEQIIYEYGKDILESENMKIMKSCMQHGNTSVYDHSFYVAYICLKIVDTYNLHVDIRSLVRGALLHDYFLYDWHEKEAWHRFHGFRHPYFALKNSTRDFDLNKIEKDMIVRHMFPMTVLFPHYKESYILCLADKFCSAKETFKIANPYFKLH